MKKISIIILILIVFILWYYEFDLFKSEKYIPNEYETELIDYFKEIALNSEYDDSPKKILKWNKSMVLFIFKDKEYKNQMRVINKTITNINKIVSDGFKIELTNDILKSNSMLFLGRRENIEALNPEFFDGIDGEFAGLASVEFEFENYEIEKVEIFIDIGQPFNLQECAILEEITQSIGLMNDSERYNNSVFYENKTHDSILTNKYSKMDKDVIKLLYNPKMKSGLNIKQSERIIKNILQNNQSSM